MDATSSQVALDQTSGSPCAGRVLVGTLASELREVVEREYAQLASEFHPANRAEQLLVKELARHAAALDHAAKAEPSVLAVSSALASDSKEVAGVADIDAALAASVTSDGTERVSRYRQGHERAFHLALRALRKLQAARKAYSSEDDEFPKQLATEEDCERYLTEWARSRQRRCPRCGQSRGDWIATRNCWECRGCHAQVGMRWGTVMHGSRLPLLLWFNAIDLVMCGRELSTAEIGQRLALTRTATVRKLVTAIHEALQSPHADVLLAGLNRQPAAFKSS